MTWHGIMACMAHYTTGNFVLKMGNSGFLQLIRNPSNRTRNPGTRFRVQQ